MSRIYRIKWLIKMLWKTTRELFKDLGNYYINPYPILLVVGAIRRFLRRCKIVWIPNGRGRPSVSEEVINLILDMKRSNKGWGALRISQELAFLGIKVSWCWRVERTFGWLNKNRRLSKDYEVMEASSEALIYISMIRMMVRRLAKS